MNNQEQIVVGDKIKCSTCANPVWSGVTGTVTHITLTTGGTRLAVTWDDGLGRCGYVYANNCERQS